MTINPRILLSGASIVAATALGIGATFAYFSDTDTSTLNTFTTGTVNININDQNAETDFQAEAVVSNWQPGQDALLNFDVKNYGSLNVNVRGFATGTWGNSALDAENRVLVTKVERWNGSGWDTLASNSSGITGLFYDSSNGTSGGTPFVITPGGMSQFQITVTLDPATGNNFQNQVFTSTLNVEAKQTNATW